jgi:hypothetical protein
MDPMSPGEPVPVPTSVRPWWKLRFSPPNPFYLLSAASFLHATGVWAQQQGRELPDAVRMGLIAGYLLLMAVTSLVIVRLWKQWNDARSILLIVLLLFAELALTFDDALLRNPRQGTLLLVSGLAIAVVVSELLFHGLGMRFPARFRVPYYAQLSLVFLYPLVLAGPTLAANRLVLTERLYGYSWLAAGSLLLLIPAIRRGARGIEDTGTPWKWPIYPWPAFVFLGLCLVARTFAQCLSFDSVSMLDMATAVNGLPSIFGAYFLSPFLLALSLLLLAIDAATGKRRFHWAASVALPAAALVMSFPGGGGNVAYREFVASFAARWCGPPLLTLAAIGCAYVVASLRGSPTGRIGLVVVLALMSVIEPETVSLSTVQLPPHPLPLAVLAMGVAIFAIRRRSSVGFALASTVGTLAIQAAGAFRDLGVPEGVIVVHLVFAGLLAAGVLFRDRWSPIWRRLSATTLVALGMAATAGVDGSRLGVLIYVIGLASGGFALAWLLRNQDFVVAALSSGILAEANSVWLAYELLSARTDWQGLPQFVLAFSLFLVGLHLSAVKGGALKRVGVGLTG